MTKVKLKAIGGSTGLLIPSDLLKQMDLKASDEVSLRFDGRSLSIRPVKKRLSLAERIAQCDFDAPLSEADVEWMNDAPRGKEIL